MGPARTPEQGGQPDPERPEVARALGPAAALHGGDARSRASCALALHPARTGPSPAVARVVVRGAGRHVQAVCERLRSTFPHLVERIPGDGSLPQLVFSTAEWVAG